MTPAPRNGMRTVLGLILLLGILACLNAFATAASAAEPQVGQITVRDGKLWDGNRPFFVKGANYGGGPLSSHFTPHHWNFKTAFGRYEAGPVAAFVPTIFSMYGYQPTDGAAVEAGKPLPSFDIQAIRTELRFLKDTLNINSIRIFTPARYRTPEGIPWFQDRVLADHTDEKGRQWTWTDDPHVPNGTINPAMLSELKEVVGAARGVGLHVQLVLFAYFEQTPDVYLNPKASWAKKGRYSFPNGGEVPQASNCKIENDNACPGSETEQFYFNYLDSLIPAFADDPTILSFEVGNETLILNYVTPKTTGTNNYSPLVLSFLTRMAGHIRGLERSHLHHLLSSGESARRDANPGAEPWFYPSPDLFRLPDIHHLRGGEDFSLAQVVDFMAPHWYVSQGIKTSGPKAEKDMNCEDFGGWRQVEPCFQEVANSFRDTLAGARRLGKPVIAGEFGVEFDDFFQSAPVYKTATANVQDEVYRRFLPLFSEGSGVVLWSPLPKNRFVDGHYTKFENKANPNLVPAFIHLDSEASPELATSDLWGIYDSDGSQPMGMSLRPAGTTFANAFR